MKQQDVDLLRTRTGGHLKFIREGGREYLQGSDHETYPVENEILCFLDKTTLGGNNSRYQEMYDRFAGFYDYATKFYAWLNGETERQRIMQYLKFLEIKDTDTVMEISIGTGRNIKHLNPKAKYYGLDISKGMLQRCRKKMNRLKREVILLQAEAENIPVQDASFDVVFSAGGFNFFNDPAKAVTEMLRIARKGARLLIYDETERFRRKHSKNKFYQGAEIRNPVEYLPGSCVDIVYKEICKGDLYVLTFTKG